ncbi:MAG: hypothetical protein U1E78_00130 [Gammaproteobacteria bacterium]
MIFRVGAEPLSNRSVHKVHEDCEMGDGNNPENSAVKGIRHQSTCFNLSSGFFGNYRHPAQRSSHEVCSGAE